MSKKQAVVDHTKQAILKVEALMYQRNQAYAFIAIQGLARDFLTFIEEKQCVQTTDAELRMLLKIYTPKKKNTKK